MSDKIAIIISTKNRQYFILKLLKYYSNFSNQISLYIGDASNDDMHQQLIKDIDKYRNILNINLVHQKHCDRFELVGTSHYELLKNVTEEYCVISGDDDYFIINSLIKSKNYLKKNLDFNSCHGHSRLMYINNNLSNASFGEYINTYEYSESSPVKRIKYLQKKYTVLQFSLQRTSYLKKIYENCKQIVHPNLLEISVVACIIIAGKSKKLNQLYIIRGVLHKLKTEVDYFEELSDKNWQNALIESRKAISIFLQKFDYKNKFLHDDVCKDYLLNYHKNIFIKHFNLKSPPISIFFKRIFKSIEKNYKRFRFINAYKYENLILRAIRSKK